MAHSEMSNSDKIIALKLSAALQLRTKKGPPEGSPNAEKEYQLFNSVNPGRNILQNRHPGFRRYYSLRPKNIPTHFF